MIRFRGLRPGFMPSWLGMTSENAAHRVAVEWDEDGERREGVFIPRRDTNSWFNKALGGRVFPGIFNRSLFEVREESGAVSVRIVRGDGGEEVAFSGRSAERMPTSSIFPSLAEAAGFFSLGATGYSATHCEGHYHGNDRNYFCRNFHLFFLRCSRLLNQFDENTACARRMQKGNKVSLSAGARVAFQHPNSAQPELLQFRREVFDLITNVMQALTALCDETAHR